MRLCLAGVVVLSQVAVLCLAFTPPLGPILATRTLTSSGSTPITRLDRASRLRLLGLEAKKKGKAGKGMRTATPSGPGKQWTKVLEDGSELGAAEGSKKAVGPYNVRGGQEQILLLVRGKEGRVRCVDATCGRCKFPLLNGRLSKGDSDIDDEDKTVLICPLCAAAHSLATGEVRGQQPQGLQGLTSTFFSRTIASGIKTYDVLEDGKAIYANTKA